jgi:hypothetical protein
MEIIKLKQKFNCCKLKDYSEVNLNNNNIFIAKTETENSIFCLAEFTPKNVNEIEKDFICLKISGILDFSLVGIIYKITKIFAENVIPVCVISTFDTDYFFIRENKIEKAIQLLKDNKYVIKE